MFIVAESGSTKTDWMVVQNLKDVEHFETVGINPSTQATLVDLKQYAELANRIRSCETIHYYGAGVIDNITQHKISELIQNVGFNGMINIHSDVVAAARACFGNDSGIIGILGTGSSAGMYDGQNVYAGTPSLGYILGDEGGGVSLGAQVLKDYFYNNMPADIRHIFQSEYNITREVVIQKLYREPNGNRYLASFASFLARVEGQWKDDLLKNAFRAFVKIHLVKPFTPIEKPIKFVGSIAFYHQNILRGVLSEYGLSIKEVIQKPINKLIDFHTENK